MNNEQEFDNLAVMVNGKNHLDKNDIVSHDVDGKDTREELDIFFDKYRDIDDNRASELGVKKIKDMQHYYDIKKDTFTDENKSRMLSSVKSLQNDSILSEEADGFNPITSIYSGVKESFINSTGLLTGASLTAEEFEKKVKYKNSTIVRGWEDELVKGISQFMTMYGTLSVASRAIPTPHPVLATAKALGVGGASAFLAFRGADGNIIDLADKYGAEWANKFIPEILGVGEDGKLNHPILGTAATVVAASGAIGRVQGTIDLLKSDPSDNELMARIKNGIADAILGVVMKPVSKVTAEPAVEAVSTATVLTSKAAVLTSKALLDQSKQVFSRTKLFIENYNAEKSIIEFSVSSDKRMTRLDSLVDESSTPLKKKNLDKETITFKEMEEASQKSTLTEEDLLSGDLSQSEKIATSEATKLKRGSREARLLESADGVKAIQLRDKAFKIVLEGVPEHRAKLTAGVSGAEEDILNEFERLIKINNNTDAIITRRDSAAGPYAANRVATRTLDSLGAFYSSFPSKDKKALAEMLLDMAELQDSDAIRKFSNSLQSTTPELFREFYIEHARYAMLSGIDTQTVAAIQGTVFDPLIMNPIEKTFMSAVDTVSSATSKVARLTKRKVYDKKSLGQLLSKVKDKEELENFIGRSLSEKEAIALKKGKLSFKEVGEAELTLSPETKTQFVDYHVNKNYSSALANYFLNSPDRDVFFTEALIGVKAYADCLSDILKYTAKTLAKEQNVDFSNVYKNPGVFAKQSVRNIVSKSIRKRLPEDKLANIDNLESLRKYIESKRLSSNKTRVEGYDHKVTVSDAIKNIRKLNQDKGGLDWALQNPGLTLTDLLSKTSSWLKTNTINPYESLSFIDNVSKYFKEYETIKSRAYAKAYKEGLDAQGTKEFVQETVTKAYNKANSDFYYSADEFIKEIQKDAVSKGEKITFTQELPPSINQGSLGSDSPHGMGSRILKAAAYDVPGAIDNISRYNPFPLAFSQLAFRKTPINMLMWVSERLPTSVFTQQFRYSLRSGGRAATEAVGKWAMGTAAGLVFYNLALENKIQGSHYESGQSDIAKATDNFATSALKLGDVSIDLRKAQPITSLMTIPATIVAISNAHPEIHDDTELNELFTSWMGYSFATLGSIISDVNSLRGMDNIVSLLNGKGGGKSVRKAIDNLHATMIVPNIFKDAANFNDDIKKVNNTFLDRIKDRMGINEVKEIDYFGNPIRKPKKLLWFLPYAYHIIDRGSVENKLMRLSVALDYPFLPRSNVYMNNSVYRFSPKEKAKLNEILALGRPNEKVPLLPNKEYYSKVFLNKDGDYNDKVIQFLDLSTESKGFNPGKQTLKRLEKKRFDQALYILRREDLELDKKLNDLSNKTEERKGQPNKNFLNMLSN